MSDLIKAARKLRELYDEHPDMFEDPDAICLAMRYNGHPDESLLDDDYIDEDPAELARYGYKVRRHYE